MAPALLWGSCPAKPESRLGSVMACPSCGNSRPPTPVVRSGLPTIWAWVVPTPDLVAVPSHEAIALIESMNGPVA